MIARNSDRAIAVTGLAGLLCPHPRVTALANSGKNRAARPLPAGEVRGKRALHNWRTPFSPLLGRGEAGASFSPRGSRAPLSRGRWFAVRQAAVPGVSDAPGEVFWLCHRAFPRFLNLSPTLSSDKERGTEKLS